MARRFRLQWPGWIAALGLSLLLSDQVRAQSDPDAANRADARTALDCAVAHVDYTEVSGLTREERIARMDRALTRSLNRFQGCQVSAETAGSGGGAPGAGIDSAAASDISGAGAPPPSGNPAKPEPKAAAAEPEAAGAKPEAAGAKPEAAAAARTVKQAPANGKIPEDIPSADNDSVLEARIRQAAVEETDPELKKRLWNEYRRYKGLPEEQ